jgi:hypothetical protein
MNSILHFFGRVKFTVAQQITDYKLSKLSSTTIAEQKRLLIVLIGGIGDSVLAINPIILFMQKCKSVKILIKADHFELLEKYIDKSAFVFEHELLNFSAYNCFILLKSSESIKNQIVRDSIKPVYVLMNPLFDKINIFQKILFKLSNKHRKRFYGREHITSIFSNMLTVATPKKIPLKSRNVLNLNIGIHVAGSADIRKLKPEVLLKLIREFPHLTFHILGSKFDLPNYNLIILEPNVINMIGKLELKYLASYLLDLRLVICPDSMIMHYADFIGVEVIALMGNISPVTYGPFNNDEKLVISRDPSCSPCSRLACKKFDGKSCVQDISAEEIASQLRNRTRA